MNLQEQINEWKKEHGAVLEMPFDDGNSSFFRKPNRRELKLIFSKAAQGGPLAMTESFVKNCLLGGDVAKAALLSEKDTSYLGQLTASIDDLLGTKKAEIKKH